MSTRRPKQETKPGYVKEPRADSQEYMAALERCSDRWLMKLRRRQERRLAERDARP